MRLDSAILIDVGVLPPKLDAARLPSLHIEGRNLPRQRWCIAAGIYPNQFRSVYRTSQFDRQQIGLMCAVRSNDEWRDLDVACFVTAVLVPANR
jgi:hypothetical protein